MTNHNKSVNQQHAKLTQKKINYRRIMIGLGIIILLVVFDLSPFGGNIRFYAKWVECGQKPVRLTSAPGAGMVWYETPPSFEPVRFGNYTYFCTASQAKAAGYASSEWGY